ncbi:MAG: VPLPA-CTERM sorting domain-containing protein [Pseudomonadota bacterium]
MKTVALAAVLALSAGAAQALTIDFDGLPGGTGVPLGTYEEDGFTISDLTNGWRQGFAFGADAPSIFTGFGPAPVEAIEIVATSGGTFNFIGYDVACAFNPCSLETMGFLGGDERFSTQSTEAIPVGDFTTFPSAFSFVTIDRLVLTLDAPDSNFDNIELTAPQVGSTEVPLPASVLLLGAALGGLGAAAHARRSAA